MTLALAREKLHYDPVELDALSRQVQMGDLTAVMQMYEEDIKSPVKSAVQGTLLRTLFIQVQKAKVRALLLASTLSLRKVYSTLWNADPAPSWTFRSTLTRRYPESTSS